MPLVINKRRLACTPEGKHFGVRLPRFRVEALTNHLPCSVADVSVGKGPLNACL